MKGRLLCRIGEEAEVANPVVEKWGIGYEASRAERVSNRIERTEGRETKQAEPREAHNSGGQQGRTCKKSIGVNRVPLAEQFAQGDGNMKPV